NTRLYEEQGRVEANIDQMKQLEARLQEFEQRQEQRQAESAYREMQLAQVAAAKREREHCGAVIRIELPVASVAELRLGDALLSFAAQNSTPTLICSHSRLQTWLQR